MNEQNSFGSLPGDERARMLVAHRLNGTATPAQVAELSELIEARPEICDYYIAQAALVSQLTVWGRVPDQAKGKPPGKDNVAAGSRTTVTWNWSYGTVLAVASLAAALLLGLFLSSSWIPAPSEPIGQMAMGTGNQPRSTIFAGEAIQVDTGDCDISLVNGVELTITAPATFVMENAMACRLWQGRLTADVPEQAIGFRVVTDHADIVDHGTRFGVAVGPDSGTDIAVFEGEVEVASHDQSLRAGRAVSIGIDGKLSRLQVVKPDTFENEAAIVSTIGSVRDNIRSLEELGFYRIVPNGFGEDQLAYVDRVHQWNGMDTNGLPEELIGGDYVMPFNDDKLVEDYEITLSLTTKANVFVLFDDRIEVPDWLNKRFVDTGEDVGQDEGRPHDHKPNMGGTAVGSGRSIDNRFSVWKCRQPLDGQVMLGAPFGATTNSEPVRQPTEVERSMYGIVAVPVNEK